MAHVTSQNPEMKGKPKYEEIDGLLVPMFPAGHAREALDYKPTPDDVFIVTYPKCGTTWMQNVVLYIFRKGKELEDHLDFHKLCPFMENKGKKGIDDMPRPGAFKTHFPFTHVPYSPEAKYIFVLRNPKDCCVSLYYHTVRAHHKTYKDATFDDFFEIFMTGEVEYGDYFDHLMSWYPHFKDSNVCFTTYEDMKRDINGVIFKLAAFLGKEYIDAIKEDASVLNNIARFSGFDYMKKHLSEAAMHGAKPQKEREHQENKPVEERPVKSKPFFHLRKGIVGDWENHFSAEQNERMNEKFIERTQGTEIYDMYKTYLKI